MINSLTPNCLTPALELDVSPKTLSTPLPSFPSIGVVSVTIQSAYLKKRHLRSTPDPFVSLCTRGDQELFRTDHQPHTYNPSWVTRTHYALIHSLDETLTLNVYDHHNVRQHRYLGSAHFQLSSLEEERSHTGVHAIIYKRRRERGDMLFDVHYYPVTHSKDLDDALAGIARITLHQARGLESTSRPSDELKPRATVSLGWNETPILRTQKCRLTGDPMWEASHEYLHLDKEKPLSLTIKVEDAALDEDEQLLGHCSISLMDLVDAKGPQWWPLIGSSRGKIMVSATWSPLDM